MDDLYDEFGNFIGEAVSDEEGIDAGDAGQNYVYDEDSDVEQQPQEDGLMEVDEE
ncbi:hypothetical protein LTR40_003864, partial [Exophiala xenobiotica]